MHYIAHRVNTAKELEKIPREYGVEIDIRDWGNKLVLQHDPFTGGESFEDYLKHYQHGTLILNVKSERIEWRILELLESFDISDYFFLDSSFPMIYQLTQKGIRNVALRISEWESLEPVYRMEGKVKWIWVDHFEKLIYTPDQLLDLKKRGFRICLVSPELQGRKSEIENYIPMRDYFDAICTKVYHIPTWQRG